MTQMMWFHRALGLYLFVHFVHIVPWSFEMFGHGQMLESPKLNATYGLFPNILVKFGDNPHFVNGFVISLALVALTFVFPLGRMVKICSGLFLWYGWACLFNSNNMILNPSLPYIGWLLLAIVAIEWRPELELRLKSGAYALLAIGYFVSGWEKFKSPSWQNGEAILHVLNNPLARDWILRDELALMPTAILSLLTWGVLALEISFLPLSYFRPTRFPVWLLMVGMHIGIALTVNFVDLTLGMLVVHAFVWDPDWTRKSFRYPFVRAAAA